MDKTKLISQDISPIWFILILFQFLICCNPPAPQISDLFAEFDSRTKQQPVRTQKDLEQVLSQLETISFANLDTAYIRKSNSKGDFKSMLQGKTYYNVKGEEVLLFLVDDFRLFEFMAKDEAFTANKKHLLQNLPQESAPGQYLLLNRRLPQKLLELMQELEKAGYNPHGFTINSCYRHPVLNLQMGSASRSRHIAGEAIDLHIRDINQDGQITQDDKTIVLDLLNKTIIKQTGGIGRYPGTMTVHFDVRGYGARWDSY